ncbi:MAG: endonuclease domain-containing protein [Oscillospiraceae bacterium]|nr:endonuclease domain-containing protein [Oscillospiraceae bacterium]
MEKNSALTKYARKLRKNQTKEEALLWYNFLRKYSPRFHRQYVIGDYIVDFYCHKAKIVVELDGSQHYAPMEIEKDRIRTEHLQNLGLQILRFTNLEVLQQFTAVCEMIDNEIRTKKV